MDVVIYINQNDLLPDLKVNKPRICPDNNVTTKLDN